MRQKIIEHEAYWKEAIEPFFLWLIYIVIPRLI